MKKFFILTLFLSLINCKSTDNLKENNLVTYKVIDIYSKPENKFDPKNIEFELIYDNEKSLFQIVNQIENENNKIDDKIIKVIYGGNIKYYKNHILKEKIFNVENRGDVFNVSSDYNEYQWYINPNETKLISGFKCFKATTHKDRKFKGEIKESFEPYAWFTYEIPTSFGPIGLDGLPGLVLEGSFDGKKIYYASKIEKTKLEIKKPYSNTTIAYEDYSNMMYNSIYERKNLEKENNLIIEKKKKEIQSSK